jgi:hypothetical protein
MGWECGLASRYVRPISPNFGRGLPAGDDGAAGVVETRSADVAGGILMRGSASGTVRPRIMSDTRHRDYSVYHWQDGQQTRGWAHRCLGLKPFSVLPTADRSAPTLPGKPCLRTRVPLFSVRCPHSTYSMQIAHGYDNMTLIYSEDHGYSVRKDANFAEIF